MIFDRHAPGFFSRLEQIRLDWNREAIRKPVNLLDKRKPKHVQSD
jgi:hypothetical protein